MYINIKKILPYVTLTSSNAVRGDEHFFFFFSLTKKSKKKNMNHVSLTKKSKKKKTWITVSLSKKRWMTEVPYYRDEHVLHKSGQDAVHYLSFQRHIILFMAIVTIVAIGVVLPLNFQGSLEGDNKEFGHTTISNLDPSWEY